MRRSRAPAAAFFPRVQGDARGERGRARRSGAAAPRRADRRRRHHDRGEVRLRPRPRERGEDAARRNAARRSARYHDRAHVPRRARAAARSGWRQGALHRSGLQHAASARRGGGTCRCRRRVLRDDRLLARADRARLRRGAEAWPAGEASRRAAFQSRRREARGRSTARSPPTISNISTRRGSPRWRRPGRSRCFFPARSIS